METIKGYIENLFANLPQTEDVLKAKAELLGMMEDKYHELKDEGKSENEAIGVVISEFGNIDELVQELEINREESEDKKFVSLTEAKDFIASQVGFAKKIAFGVMLCILSPIALTVLSGLAESGKIALNEDAAGAIGTCILLIIIAAAVGIFITSGISVNKYEYLAKSQLSLEPATKAYVTELDDKYKNKFTAQITIGVILCIISAMPLIVSGCIIKDSEANTWIYCIFTGLLLFIVAVAVVLFVNAGIIHGSYAQLLEKEDYSPEKKQEKANTDKIGARIGGFFWPIAVIIYLAWSFITADWHITWIVWPIAGVSYWAITSIINAVKNK